MVRAKARRIPERACFITFEDLISLAPPLFFPISAGLDGSGTGRFDGQGQTESWYFFMMPGEINLRGSAPKREVRGSGRSIGAYPLRVVRSQEREAPGGFEWE
jgi:hypothetical protein